VLQQPKRPPARARRIAGILAALAVTVAAVAVSPSPANAVDPTGLPLSAGDGRLPAIPAQARQFAVPFKKLPAGARRATRGAEKPGPGRYAFAPSIGRGRVVGGTPVNAADFPGVVGIQTTFLGTDADGNVGWYIATCTGTVLSPTRVLTAAHCSVYYPYGHTEVIAGRDNLATPGSGFVARVASTWTHQGYNLEAQFNDPNATPIDDVTVLTLKDALPAVYTPVALADQGAADPAGGTEATIVGYGVTNSDADDSGILRAGAVPIETDARCGAADQWLGRFDPNRMMCAGLPPTTDTCFGDSGGPIFTGTAGSRVQVGITDWGSEDCAASLGVYEALNYYSAVVKQQITHVGPNNLDFTGDGHSDLFGRLRSNGQLIIGTGSGLSTGTLTGFSYFAAASTSNWNGYTKLFRVNNWGGDGTPSVFARDAAGKLYNYRTDGAGAFIGGSPRQIGTGWNAYTDIMVTNDWTGNGLPNLMGRTADGHLVLYNSDGAGGWSNPRGTPIGSGWNRFNTVLTPGAWLGDGHQSLIGRTKGGELWLYNSNGAGGWTNPAGTKIGSGWGGFSTFMSPGDWNGDNLVDLLGVASNGDLRMYTTDGKGSWLTSTGRKIDEQWNDFNVIF
jgi:Trypsin